jgi:hypothetical protein
MSMQYCPKCGYQGKQCDFKGQRSRVCALCGKKFIAHREDQKYCSESCRCYSWNKKMGKEYFAKKQREHRAKARQGI